MSNQYGPWATPIGAGGNPQLSAFWRQRLTKLVPTSQSSPTLSRRSLLCLGAAGAMTALLPTLRSTSAADEEKPAKDERKPLAGRVFFQGSVKQKSGSGQSGIYAVDLETGHCEMIIKAAGGFRLSPDGKTLAFEKQPISNLCEIWTYDMATHAAARVLDNSRGLFSSAYGEKGAKYIFSGGPICWSPDGKKIVACSHRWSEDHKESNLCIVRQVNRDGSGPTTLPIPKTDEVDDWSPDGKWFVTVSNRHPPYGVGYQLYRMRPDGSEQLRLTKDGLNCYPRFSPDGRQIVYHRSYGASNRYTLEICVMDSDGSNNHVIVRNEELASFNDACWSPDGRRLAVDWLTEVLEHGVKVAKIGEEAKHRIEIVDADGTNRREVKFADATPRFICNLNWQ